MPSKKIVLIILSLIAADVVAFTFIFVKKLPVGNSLYFLNVGQADGEMVNVKGAHFLIDSGQNSGILGNLEKLISPLSKRIDVVFLSHGQQDHMGGMFYIIKNYSIGAVVYNGDETPLWQNLKKELQSNAIPCITVSQGDKVSYAGAEFDVLWPDGQISETGSNENSMVIKYSDSKLSSLFTADISSAVESLLPLSDIGADVLKVPHHGSKYSSSQNFVSAVAPKLAVIEVGKNSYGHPTKEAIDRILSLGTEIFRTDLNGIVKVDYAGGKIRVSSLR